MCLRIINWELGKCIEEYKVCRSGNCSALQVHKDENITAGLIHFSKSFPHLLSRTWSFELVCSQTLLNASQSSRASIFELTQVSLSLVTFHRSHNGAFPRNRTNFTIITESYPLIAFFSSVVICDTTWFVELICSQTLLNASQSFCASIFELAQVSLSLVTCRRSSVGPFRRNRMNITNITVRVDSRTSRVSTGFCTNRFE